MWLGSLVGDLVVIFGVCLVYLVGGIFICIVIFLYVGDFCVCFLLKGVMSGVLV